MDRVGLIADWGYPLLIITDPTTGAPEYYYPKIDDRFYSSEPPTLVKGHPWWLTPTRHSQGRVAVFVAEDKDRHPYPFLLDVRE